MRRIRKESPSPLINQEPSKDFKFPEKPAILKPMILSVKITPNASQNSIVGWQGDLLRIRIAAPPDKGKANDELIEFLAEKLGVPKSDIQLLSGQASRPKRLEIRSIPNRQ